MAARAPRRLMLSRLRAAAGRDRRHAVGRLAAARAAGARAGRRSRICCCSTSRPITSTSRRSPGSRRFSPSIAGAVMFVTHDRAFLQRLATRIVELDRGRLTSWPGDYATYPAAQGRGARQRGGARRSKFDKKLAEEEVWLRQGIKARRTRNEGRVRALMAMRAERAARREQIGNVRLQVEQADASGKLVFEAEARSSQGATAGREPVVARFLDAHHARRSHRPDRPERRRQDDAAAAAARRARRRTPARCGTAPTCRSPTTISSASSSIPSGPCSTRSARATTR